MKLNHYEWKKEIEVELSKYTPLLGDCCMHENAIRYQRTFNWPLYGAEFEVK